MLLIFMIANIIWGSYAIIGTLNIITILFLVPSVLVVIFVLTEDKNLKLAIKIESILLLIGGLALLIMTFTLYITGRKDFNGPLFGGFSFIFIAFFLFNGSNSYVETQEVNDNPKSFED